MLEQIFKEGDQGRFLLTKVMKMRYSCTNPINRASPPPYMHTHKLPLTILSVRTYLYRWQISRVMQQAEEEEMEMPQLRPLRQQLEDREEALWRESQLGGTSSYSYPPETPCVYLSFILYLVPV